MITPLIVNHTVDQSTAKSFAHLCLIITTSKHTPFFKTADDFSQNLPALIKEIDTKDGKLLEDEFENGNIKTISLKDVQTYNTFVTKVASMWKKFINETTALNGKTRADINNITWKVLQRKTNQALKNLKLQELNSNLNFSN